MSQLQAHTNGPAGSPPRDGTTESEAISAVSIVCICASPHTSYVPIMRSKRLLVMHARSCGRVTRREYSAACALQSQPYILAATQLRRVTHLADAPLARDRIGIAFPRATWRREVDNGDFGRLGSERRRLHLLAPLDEELAQRVVVA